MQQYRPAEGRSRLALLAFCVWALTALAVVVAETARLHILDVIRSGVPVSVNDTMFSDGFVGATAWLEISAYAAAAVAFLLWLRRVVENNRALGAPAWTRTHAATAAAALGLFVLSGAVRYAAALTGQPQNPIAGLTDSSFFEVGSIVLAGVSAVCAVTLLVVVTRRQSHFALGASAARYAPPAPPPLADPAAVPAHLQLPAWPGEL